MSDTPSIDQLRNGPPMVTLLVAAAVLGLGRTKAYELVRNDEFPVPVKRIGSRYRVPVPALLDYVGFAGLPPVSPPRPAPGGRTPVTSSARPL